HRDVNLYIFERVDAVHRRTLDRGASPSSVMPSAVRNATVAARSSTTTLTWSKLPMCAAGVPVVPHVPVQRRLAPDCQFGERRGRHFGQGRGGIRRFRPHPARVERSFSPRAKPFGGRMLLYASGRLSCAYARAAIADTASCATSPTP